MFIFILLRNNPHIHIVLRLKRISFQVFLFLISFIMFLFVLTRVSGKQTLRRVLTGCIRTRRRIESILPINISILVFHPRMKTANTQKPTAKLRAHNVVQNRIYR